jgi:hypothetical protein
VSRRTTWHNDRYDSQAGDDVPRKGRARRFREARRLKQGYDDGLFREGNGTLADVSDDQDELDEYDDADDWGADDSDGDGTGDEDEYDPLKY